jgi:hypothetical protein
VVIGPAQLARVEKAIGKKAVLAVSPGGVVQLAADGSRWNPIFGGEQKVAKDGAIDVDLKRLNLENTDFMPALADARLGLGRIAGPQDRISAS